MRAFSKRTHALYRRLNLVLILDNIANSVLITAPISSIILGLALFRLGSPLSFRLAQLALSSHPLVTVIIYTTCIGAWRSRCLALLNIFLLKRKGVVSLLHPNTPVTTHRSLYLFEK